MAWELPKLNEIHADIQNLTIYLRTTKKWGKTTLFRDVILEKYKDPSYGLLVQCGKERGATMLDSLNIGSIKTYKDALEMKKWLIEEKGKQHHIKIIAFDTVDELVPIFEKETIRLSKIENPDKPCRSINGAFGGFQAGQRYTANDLIKPFMDELREAGFGIWAISHTKFKTIKEKGGTDENGYQQLTSNLEAAYESAFGDIFDVCLTGVIDRDIEEHTVTEGEKTKVKRYATDIVRKLYFRETPLIDAGGRFSAGSVPDYMVFDKWNMAPEFIQVVEEGMEKSKISTDNRQNTVSEFTETVPVFEDEIAVEFDTYSEYDDAELKEEIRKLYRAATDESKSEIMTLLDGRRFNDVDDRVTLCRMMDLLSK